MPLLAKKHGEDIPADAVSKLGGLDTLSLDNFRKEDKKSKISDSVVSKGRKKIVSKFE